MSPYPGLPPGVPNYPIFCPVLHSPASHRHDVIHCRWGVVLCVQSPCVGIQLFSSHYATAVGKQREDFSHKGNQGLAKKQLFVFLHFEFWAQFMYKLKSDVSAELWHVLQWKCTMSFKYLFFLPNWSISVDFCHHFFSSTDRPVVSNFPESVVLDHMAFSKSDTSSTLVELLTLCKTEMRLSLQEGAFLQMKWL